jgi:hypothetical protein
LRVRVNYARIFKIIRGGADRIFGCCYKNPPQQFRLSSRSKAEDNYISQRPSRFFRLGAPALGFPAPFLRQFEPKVLTARTHPGTWVLHCPGLLSLSRSLNLPKAPSLPTLLPKIHPKSVPRKHPYLITAGVVACSPGRD